MWSPRGTFFAEGDASEKKQCETLSRSISNILSSSDWQSSDVHEIVKHVSTSNTFKVDVKMNFVRKNSWGDSEKIQLKIQFFIN